MTKFLLKKETSNCDTFGVRPLENKQSSTESTFWLK